MSEDAFLLGKSAIASALQCFGMIKVGPLKRSSHLIINLCYTFLTTEAFRYSFCVGHRRCPVVLLVVNYIIAGATEIVCCSDHGDIRSPRLSRLDVFRVLWLTCYAIVEALEGSILVGWL